MDNKEVKSFWARRQGEGESRRAAEGTESPPYQNGEGSLNEEAELRQEFLSQEVPVMETHFRDSKEKLSMAALAFVIHPSLLF